MDQEPKRDDTGQVDAGDNASQEETGSSEPVVDWETALDVAADDPQLLLEVLDAFMTETPRMVKAIGEALRDRNVEVLHRSAHTVKNAFLNIGARQASDLAFEVERLSKQQQLEELPQLVERLEKLADAVQSEVTRYMDENRAT